MSAWKFMAAAAIGALIAPDVADLRTKTMALLQKDHAPFQEHLTVADLASTTALDSNASMAPLIDFLFEERDYYEDAERLLEEYLSEQEDLKPELVKPEIPNITVSYQIVKEPKQPAKATKVSLEDKILSLVASGNAGHSLPRIELPKKPEGAQEVEVEVVQAAVSIPGFKEITLEDVQKSSPVEFLVQEKRRITPVGLDDSSSMAPDEGIVSNDRILQRIPRRRPDIDQVIAQAEKTQDTMMAWAGILEGVEIQSVSTIQSEPVFEPGSKVAQASNTITPSDRSMDIIRQMAADAEKNGNPMTAFADFGTRPEPEAEKAPQEKKVQAAEDNLRVELSYVVGEDKIEGRVRQISDFFPKALQKKGRWYASPLPNGNGIYAVGFEAKDDQALEDIIYYTQVMNIPTAQRRSF